MALSTAAAAAQPVSDNLGIVDDPSYARFQSAMAMSSYAMADYALAENPRVAATVTAGLVFLSVNPLASQAQVTDYIARFSADLAAYDPSDPNLLQGTSFFAAVRSMDRGPSGFVSDGLDTRVSARVLDALRVGVRTPLDFESIQRRMVTFEIGRIRSFTNAPELPLILTQGLIGNDIDGNYSPFISAVIQAYLIGEGFEIIPDGVDDERFDLVTPSLTAMPPDFAAYMAFQASIDPMDVAASPAHGDIMGAFDGLKANGDELQVELAAKVAQGTSILEAAENADDPVIVEQVLDELREDIRQDSGYWTDLQWRTMLMLQSQRDEVRSYSTSVRSFAHVRLETNNEFFTAKKGTELATGAAIAFAQFKSGDVLDSVSWAITSGIEIVDAFGLFGDSPPSAEEQIFDQIVEVRMDIENLRVEMHDRFNRLESTLNQMQLSMNASFAQIGNAIGDLSADVEDLSRDIAVSRSILDRIEDALYRMASDTFWNDFAAKVNLVLNYRSGGLDLIYGNTSPSFFESAKSLLSFNTVTAALEAFAGPDAPGSATFDDAQSVLNGESIGRDINYLRSLPPRLSNTLQPLSGNRVAALGPWAQSATVYAQLLRENPWYLGYMYEQQTTSPGQADLDAVIEKGEDLNEMMSAGRSQELFDELIRGYNGEIMDLHAREQQVIDSVNSSIYPGSGFDVLGTMSQPFVRAAVPPPPSIISPPNYPDTPPLHQWPVADPQLWWMAFEPGVDLSNHEVPTNMAPMLWAIVTSISLQNGVEPQFSYEWDAIKAGDNGHFIFYLKFSGGTSGPGINTEFRLWRTFLIRVRETGTGDVWYVNNDRAARNFGELFWARAQAMVLGGTSLAGAVIPDPIVGNDYIVLNDYDNNQFSDLGGRNKLQELMEYKQSQIWEDLNDDNTIAVDSDQLLDWATLLDAYSTLSMPDMIDESDVARAALRGRGFGPVSFTDPTTIDYRDSNALRVDVSKFYEMNQADLQNAMLVSERLGPNIDAFENAADYWLTLPFPGHAYLNYTLEDLRNLRESAFELAVDDQYEVGVALTVSAEEGLLANDVDQEYRAIVVESYTQPAEGSVVVEPDGSFTYSAPQPFGGTVSFTYTTSAEITEIDGEPQYFESAPATVVLKIENRRDCLADVNGDGVLNAADFTAWIDAFNNNLFTCDQNGDGSCTPTDFTAWIANYNAGCIE